MKPNAGNSRLPPEQPGKHRALGFERAGCKWKDVKLPYRDARMRLWLPPEGASPAEQEKFGLDNDTGCRVTNSEGEGLRE